MQKPNLATWPQPFPAPAPAIIRMNAACVYLGVCRSTLYKAIKNCELQPVKIGRATGFTQASLDAFIALRIAATPQVGAPARAAAPEVEAGIVASTR